MCSAKITATKFAQNKQACLYLAPMEGVLDSNLRHVLATINDFNLVVSEFLRISDCVPAKKHLCRYFPELHNNAVVANKTPLRAQLLGNNATLLGVAAKELLHLGSNGIDINFGCPSRRVNQHKSGAYFLQFPEQIYKILSHIRNVTQGDTLSAKIRIGYDDDSLYEDILAAIVDSKVDELTIHCRTKKQGYKPKAQWSYLAKAADSLASSKIKLIANGDIFTKDDYLAIKNNYGICNVMLGRGILAIPNLCNVIKYDEDIMSWHDVLKLIISYYERLQENGRAKHFPSLLKQWLFYLMQNYSQAKTLFDDIKSNNDGEEILTILIKMVELSGIEPLTS